VAKVKEYKTQIEQELHEYCTELLNLVKDYLLPNSQTAQVKVFFHKMMADYYRYIAEYASAVDKNLASQRAQQAYKDAQTLANENLTNTHPVKLGLALNYSVFFYEIMQDPESACSMARTAFDEAISDLDNVEDEDYKDATLIMQLLRDNLTLWTSELIEEGEK